jgi:hypothetical protein
MPPAINNEIPVALNTSSIPAPGSGEGEQPVPPITPSQALQNMQLGSDEDDSPSRQLFNKPPVASLESVRADSQKSDVEGGGIQAFASIGKEFSDTEMPDLDELARKTFERPVLPSNMRIPDSSPSMFKRPKDISNFNPTGRVERKGLVERTFGRLSPDNESNSVSFLVVLLSKVLIQR